MANNLTKVLYVLICIVLFGTVWNALQIKKKDPTSVEITLEARITNSDEFQLFFDPADIGYFEQNSQKVSVRSDLDYQSIVFSVRSENGIHGLRLDPGKGPATMSIKSLKIAAAYSSMEFGPAQIDSLFEFNDVCTISLDRPGVLELTVNGADPYFSSKESLVVAINELKTKRRPIFWPFLISSSLALLFFLFLVKLDPVQVLIKGRKDILQLLRALWNRRTALSLLLAALTWWVVELYFDQVAFVEPEISLLLSGTFPQDDSFQVYYSSNDKNWNANNHLSAEVIGSNAPQLVVFNIPKELTLERIRIDLGSHQTNVQLDSISLISDTAHISWLPNNMIKAFTKNDHIRKVEVRYGRYRMEISGNDAYLRSKMSISSFQAEVLKRSAASNSSKYFAWAFAVLIFLSARGLYPTLVSLGPEQRPALLLSASFGLLIFLPLLSRVIPIEPASYNTEKRIMALRPVLEAKSLLTYPDRYNAYYSDHFGYRKVLIRWNALVKGIGLGVSPNKQSVLFGKKGWLYYLGEGVDTHHRNSELFSLQQLEALQYKLENRNNWLKEQGIDYYLTIPPLKSTIYPEYLPDRMTRVRPTSKLDQLIDHLKIHSFIRVIDMREKLFAEKKEKQVYYKTDTHWNVLGAFYGYRVLIQRIAKDHPEIRPFELKEFGFEFEQQDKGDLALLSGLNDILLRRKIMLLPKKPFNAENGEPLDYPINNFFKYESQIFENDSISNLKLVMFRDSYTVYLQPFLSEHFSRSGYFWTPIFHPDVVKAEKPDIVIHQIMERFIDDLLLDDPGEPRYDQ